MRNPLLPCACGRQRPEVERNPRVHNFPEGSMVTCSDSGCPFALLVSAADKDLAAKAWNGAVLALAAAATAETGYTSKQAVKGDAAAPQGIAEVARSGGPAASEMRREQAGSVASPAAAPAPKEAPRA